MLLYRLTKCAYANDLSGSGSRLYGGRWNSEGKAMLYLASSRALAVLEALVHLPPSFIPDEYCMVTIEAPDDFQIINDQSLPENWQDSSDMELLKQVGNAFLTERKSLLLKVPSAIINQEYNYLLNPMHNLVQKIKVNDVKPFTFDPRLIND